VTKHKENIYEFRTRRIKRSFAMESIPAKIYDDNHVAALVRKITDGDAREHFIVFFIDSKNKVIGYEVIAIGSLSNVEVHPRELFRPAIVAPAAAIILAHNHPSGDPEHSRSDLELTRRACACGDLLGIPVLDHVIVGDAGHTSLHKEGFIPERESDD